MGWPQGWLMMASTTAPFTAEGPATHGAGARRVGRVGGGARGPPFGGGAPATHVAGPCRLERLDGAADQFVQLRQGREFDGLGRLREQLAFGLQLRLVLVAAGQLLVPAVRRVRVLVA